MIRFNWPKPPSNGGLSNDGLVITVQGGPGASHRARKAVEVLAPDLARPVNHVQLLVSELVTNSVRHGNVGEEGRVSLDVAMRDGVVRVTVTDSGPGFTPRPPVVDPSTDGGVGLLIVDRIAKNWGVSHGGRSVWFEVRRQPAPALAAQAGS